VRSTSTPENGADGFDVGRYSAAIEAINAKGIRELAKGTPAGVQLWVIGEIKKSTADLW